MREGVLRDVVGIVAGYLASGAAIPNGTRFTAWDRMVRQPLMWAGASDLAEAFRKNAEKSEDVLAHRMMLDALCEMFPDSVEFAAADVVKKLELHHFGEDTPAGRLQSAMLNLRSRNTSSERSVGRVLRAKVDRIGLVGDDESPRSAVLRSRVLRGQTLYRVEVSV
jgi:hypothetical protein